MHLESADAPVRISHTCNVYVSHTPVESGTLEPQLQGCGACAGKGDFKGAGYGGGKGDYGKPDFGKGDFGKADFGKADFGKAERWLFKF